MRKPTAKKKIASLIEAVETLLMEVEEAIEDIQPYEDREELTTAQEERLEWFEDLQDTLQDFIDNLENKMEE